MKKWTMEELEDEHLEWLHMIVEATGVAATSSVLDAADKGLVDKRDCCNAWHCCSGGGCACQSSKSRD